MDPRQGDGHYMGIALPAIEQCSKWHARLYEQSIYLEEFLKQNVLAQVSFGATCYPREIGCVPKWWAQASVADNIVFWKEHDDGPPIECPEVS
jgi:hypothetical protein